MRAAPSAAEHAVARREAVEVQRLGAISAGRRRTDRQREREAFACPHERGRAGDALVGEVVRGADLVEVAEPAPVVARARRRADDLAALVDAIRGRIPTREGNLGDFAHGDGM